MQVLHFRGCEIKSCNTAVGDMAATAEQLTTLARLRKMRDAGVTSTTVDGVATTFRSLRELKQAIVDLEREAGLRNPRVRARSVYMGHR